MKKFKGLQWGIVATAVVLSCVFGVSVSANAQETSSAYAADVSYHGDGIHDNILFLAPDGLSVGTYVDARLVEVPYSNTGYFFVNTEITSKPHINIPINKAIETDYLYYGGAYQTKYDNVALADYTAYINKLKAYGFTQTYTSVLNTDDCYLTYLTYGSSEYAVQYFSKTKELYIVLCSDQQFSPYMDATYFSSNSAYKTGEPRAAQPYENVTITTVALSSGGDCYIIRLRNGHYIIIDSGTGNQTDRNAIAEALGAKIYGSNRNPRIIVDAWFFTHEHGDHIGLFHGGVSGALSRDVYVKGFYYNFTDYMSKEVGPINGDSKGIGNSTYKWQGKSGGVNYYSKTGDDTMSYWFYYALNTAMSNNINRPLWAGRKSGDGIPSYRLQAGQKFYFDGVTVEIPYTQEQVQLGEYAFDINASSAWMLLTVMDSTTFLEAGDTEHQNMTDVEKLYDNDYGIWGADIVHAPHHGLNGAVVYSGSYGDRTPSASTNRRYNYALTDKLYGINPNVGDGNITQFIFYNQATTNNIFGYSSVAADVRDIAVHENYYLTHHALTYANGNTVGYAGDFPKNSVGPISFACYGVAESTSGLTHNTFEQQTTVTVWENGFVADRMHAGQGTKYLENITYTLPQKLAYRYGEELDLTGLEVTAHYSDGSKTKGGYSVDAPELSAVGSYTVNISVAANEKIAYSISVDDAGDGWYLDSSGLLTIYDDRGMVGYRDTWNKHSQQVTSVVICQGVTHIGQSAFEGFKILASVTIPDSVTTLGGTAFAGCTALKTLTIPSNVTVIGEAAFQGCTALTDIYYMGAGAQWNAVEIQDGNEALKNATVHLVEGWYQVGSHWYFSKDGQNVTGWLQDGAWYYMDETGAMVTGEHLADGGWSRFSASGAWIGYITGWYYAEGNWYYLNSVGVAQTGWILDGSWYYMDETGAMVTGQYSIGGVLHNFNSSGVWLGEVQVVKKNGWALEDGAWYYYKNDVKQTGWIQDGAWYYMDETGAMVTGEYTIGGVLHNFNSSGVWLGEVQIVKKNGWALEEGTWCYYKNDVKQTGWILDGSWYYMDDDGAMVTGEVLIDGQLSLFNASGVWLGYKSGWVMDDGDWYYYTSGVLLKGWLQQGSIWYYMDESGVMVTGNTVIDGVLNRFNASGVWLGY